MKTQRNNPLGCVVLLAIISLAVGVISAAAQNIPANYQNVPPTARQAATMPQFAAKLAHPAHPAATANASRVINPPRARASGKPGSQACAPTDGHRLPQDIVYSNGPINGTTDAYTINFGFIVADTFTVPSGGSTVTGMTFGGWVFPGDVAQSVEISITSSPFGGTSYFDGVVSLSQSNCNGNQYGYNVCTETSAAFSGPTLSAGTYWVNLQNAVTFFGNPLYWDENSGPSLAEENSYGTIPSESFSILGNTTPPPPPPPQNQCIPEHSWAFNVIHDFTGQGDGGWPSGLAVDRSGNLYGASGSGSSGMVYKMAQAGSGWVLSGLYDFTDEGNGAAPAGVILGRNGILYGVANADSQGFGSLIFGLRPAPRVCMSISCPWTENVLYGFAAGDTGGYLTTDEGGNFYGIGGEGGYVFKLTPTLGGWIETVLYTFTGGGGGGATSLLVGNDGNLYGTTQWGGANNQGVVFQLVPSANGWIENVIYNFPSEPEWSWPPGYLVQDAAGNLFGIYGYAVSNGYWYNFPSRVFVLQPSNGQWVYTEIAHNNEYFDSDQFINLTIDRNTGILWGTGQGSFNGCINPIYNSYIFEVVPAGGSWNYSLPMYWDNTYWGQPSGALAVDGQGNLYGTTRECGSNEQGTIWQMSP